MLILLCGIVHSQNLEYLTYEQVNNYEDFKKIKKGKLKSYLAKDGTTLKVGDAILLGQPYDAKIFKYRFRRWNV